MPCNRSANLLVIIFSAILYIFTLFFICSIMPSFISIESVIWIKMDENIYMSSLVHTNTRRFNIINVILSCLNLNNWTVYNITSMFRRYTLFLVVSWQTVLESHHGKKCITIHRTREYATVIQDRTDRCTRISCSISYASGNPVVVIFRLSICVSLLQFLLWLTLLVHSHLPFFLVLGSSHP